MSAASRAVLAARAALVLGRNADGPVVKPARGLYPHQWSWDTGFIAVALARVDTEMARASLDALFTGQWRTGMVPHIVFDPASEGYFPDPARWACSAVTADAPAAPQTSGICQPPIHALAATAILENAPQEGPHRAATAREWAAALYPKLLAWHRFLARERVDPASGLVRIFHGWESGMDNSPRWDAAYARVQVRASLPPYERRDLAYVHDASERPSRAEYDRYLTLVEEFKEAAYDQARLAQTCSFVVGDVFFTAIFALANEHLGELCQLLGGDEGDEIAAYADGARGAVRRRMVGGGGTALDLDLRTGADLAPATIAEFSPLVAGGLPLDEVRRLRDRLLGPDWAGHPELRWPVPPSTSPASDFYRPRTYWRGPVWPVMTWLLALALERAGEREAAEGLRRATVAQLGDGRFGEYYEPMTGEFLGSGDHSWTAAVLVDLLCGRGPRRRIDREAATGKMSVMSRRAFGPSSQGA